MQHGVIIAEHPRARTAGTGIWKLAEEQGVELTACSDHLLWQSIDHPVATRHLGKVVWSSRGATEEYYRSPKLSNEAFVDVCERSISYPTVGTIVTPIGVSDSENLEFIASLWKNYQALSIAANEGSTLQPVLMYCRPELPWVYALGYYSKHPVTFFLSDSPSLVESVRVFTPEEHEVLEYW